MKMGSMRTHLRFYPDNWEWRDCRQARKRPVEGVGTNNADYAVKPRINGKELCCPAYRSWYNMLKRCYNKKYRQHYPTYAGTTCTKTWLLFSNFRRWYFQQRDLISHYDYEGSLELDKDILSDSKIYGPENCVLVTPSLNSLLLDCKAVRGDYPVGVSKWYGRFRAHIRINGKQKYKAGFNTPEEAAQWRLQKKLEHVSNYPLPPWLDEAKVRRRLIKIVKAQS